MREQYPTGIWENENLLSEPGGYDKSLMIGNRRGTGTEPPDRIYPIFALIGTLVLLILIVACSNLGSLLLARGVARLFGPVLASAAYNAGPRRAAPPARGAPRVPAGDGSSRRWSCRAEFLATRRDRGGDSLLSDRARLRSA